MAFKRKRGVPSIVKKTTTLPKELLGELAALQDQSKGVDGPDKKRKKKEKPVLTRKQSRQAKKDEKKQQRQMHHLLHKTKKGAVIQESIVVSKKPESSHKTNTKKEIPTASLPNANESSNHIREKQMKKFATTNPHLYQLLCSDNLIAHSEQLDAGNSQKFVDSDSKEIKRLEKNLKIKNNKLPTSFAEDGLDYLLDVLPQFRNGEKLSGEESENEYQLDLPSEKNSDSSDIDEEGELSDRNLEEVTFLDEEDDIEFSYLEDEEIEDTIEDNDCRQNVEMEINQIELPEEPDLKFEKESVDPSTTMGKYVPPQLRNKSSETKNEAYLRLQRKMQGLMNKLSENNMEGIFQEVEALYRENPRHDVTEIITNLIISSVADKANLLDSFVLLYGAFLSSIHKTMGTDIAASIVQNVVETFLKHYDSYRNTLDGKTTEAIAENDNEEEMAERKQAINLIVLISQLYNFQVVSCILIYDIIRESIKSLTEVDVEILLRVIRLSGHQLRADDPLSLKQIIEMIQDHSSAKGENLGSRFRFMLETIYDLKNNKKRKHMASQADSATFSQLKKFVNNLAKKRHGFSGGEPIRVSLSDIKSVNEKGKWWLVGAAWVGNQASEENQQVKKVVEDTLDNSLLKLAKAQRMNTDIRKSIFIILMSSEDYINAFQRLLKLGLKEKQQREISRIILHCCGNEKVFNPYYAYLSHKLCTFNHSFRMTFQFCFWDILKEMDEFPLQKLSNLSKLYSHLLKEDGLGLTILKVLSFQSLSKKTILFLRLLFIQLLTSISPPQLTSISQKLKQSPDMETLIEGLLFFFHHYFHNSDIAGLVGSQQSDEKLEKIELGIKVLKKMMIKGMA